MNRQISSSLDFDALTRHLKQPCELRVFEEVDSTNNIVKEEEVLRLKPLMVVADRQTAGRGRLGRSFASPGGTGIYMTIGIRPKFALDKAPFVTMAVAVAVCRAIEKVTGIQGQIKWVNDIFHQKRKVCGILTEAQTDPETGLLDKLIIGIGVNCFPSPFPEELANIAGPLSDDPGSFSREELIAEIFNETMDILKGLETMEFLKEYRSKCFILGKNILVHPRLNDQSIRARAIDIDDQGGLVVEYMEGSKIHQRESLTTGEISIRLEA